ncbi:hypothetical protein DH2020_006769 [Rehmannia glutinosa]|uniref:SWI/SNF complex subunit SWI3D n=1 Tax=Rehmannia glutinosa TaxID=99300 RepID=A0ABR0XK24_REHGL
MTEVSPAEQPMSRRRGAGQKRKSTSINSSGGGSSTPQTTSSKRQAREKPPAVPFPPIHMNGPCTRARVQPFNSNGFAEVAPVKSEAEAREAAAKAEEMNRVAQNWEALEAKIEAEYEAIRSRDANVHVVPIHAGWFSWTKIHPLEEKMLPSFFNGKSESRTPEIYMEIRNWIMKKFHLNPNEQIELKHLSELTVGKLDARQEVMEFLDYWGLINYHPFPHHEPTAMIVDADADKDEAGKKDSLVEKLFQFETVQSWTPIVPRVNTAVPAMSSGLYPDSAVADELVKSEGPAVEYHCNSCSADCSRKRYHCQKQVSLFLPLFFPFVFRSILSCSLIAYTYIFHEIYYFAEPICKQADFDLCADCFNNGKFGSNMHPSDFILMEPAEAGGVSGGNWTDQETLLLLEAIELFRDNWSEIAEHVATKTKAQCILHFVQMPIEDAFFNRDDENSDAPKENRVPVSTTTEDSAPKADRDCDTALKDVPENTEIQGVNTDNQDSSCPMEISKPDEVGESDRNVELEESFALKALKEAFEAVGSLPSPGERLSFAEAGNPVMTLAAFLVRLVEPNIANASVRSLLKYLSGNYSSEQLAARHCFPLQDPPDYKKNLANSEGAEAEAIEHDAQKNEVQHAEKQEETPDSIVDGINQKPVASPSGDRADRSGTVKDSDKLATHEEAQLASESEPSSSDFAKEQARKDAEELVVPASHTELQSNSVKESDGASAGEATQSKELLKDEDMTTSISEKKEADVLAIPNSITEKENTGDREAKESVGEKKEPVVTKNELDVNDKLKRAAVTAISAAAVKAKFLADQEEDQILRLSTLLIEKQLYKLEAKLAFFNDMENVVMRVKEQLDRSKQKLFHERAQIIATRFGMSASARPTTQNLPPNRTAVNFPTSASRPFMGMNALRPPISRPMMSANPTSSTFMTASAPGSSMQPNTDRLSSVGMK